MIGETNVFGSCTMRLTTRVLAAGAILLGLTVGAQATTLGYDNLNDTPVTSNLSGSYNAFSTYSANGSELGASFTANASLDLTDVSLLLSNGGQPTATPGSMLVVSLWSDNGSSAPGTQLVQIRSVYDSLITQAYNAPSMKPYDFQLSTPYALTSGTRYWIVATDVGGTALWSNSATVDGGASGEYNLAGNTSLGGGTYANSGFALQMCVSNGSNSAPSGACSVSAATTFTTDSSPTPEPASVAILGAAVIGLAAARRFRKA